MSVAETSGVPPTETVETVEFDFRQTIRDLKEKLREQETHDREFRKMMTDILTNLEKEYTNMRKTLVKPTKRRQHSDNVNSGINQVYNISKELAKFLDLDPKTPVKRGLVTRKISEYIKSKNLSNPQDGRRWTPDKALQKVLAPLAEQHKEQGYGYFNLQSYIKHHFTKST
jgi:chromatin remodeling complex protein RSC6